jgi:hypothetical protein
MVMERKFPTLALNWVQVAQTVDSHYTDEAVQGQAFVIYQKEKGEAKWGSAP